MRSNLVRELQRADNGMLGWDFWIRSANQRSLDEVFCGIQVSPFKKFEKDALLGFAPLESIVNFERRSFEHLFMAVDRLLYGVIGAYENPAEQDMKRGVLFRTASDILSDLSLFADTPEEKEKVFLREVLLEPYRREDHLIELYKTPLEELQERMHERLPESPLFQSVENLVRAKDELEEQLKDPGYFKK